MRPIDLGSNTDSTRGVPGRCSRRWKNDGASGSLTIRRCSRARCVFRRRACVRAADSFRSLPFTSRVRPPINTRTRTAASTRALTQPATPVQRLAAVELQLTTHRCGQQYPLAMARCNRFTSAAASVSCGATSPRFDGASDAPEIGSCVRVQRTGVQKPGAHFHGPRAFGRSNLLAAALQAKDIRCAIAVLATSSHSAVSESDGSGLIDPSRPDRGRSLCR